METLCRLFFVFAILTSATAFAQPTEATKPTADHAKQQTAYLSGSCFWGMEELVREILGVLATEAGYTSGDTPGATYKQVKTGRTGHAESLKIVFDPKWLAYRHLLFEFFRMHNQATRNWQDSNIGTQCR